jgi:protein-disulfide isomerase
VNESTGGRLTAGILGGIVGAALTAMALVFAAPGLIGPRLVRDAIIRDPDILIAGTDALKAKQAVAALGPIRAALETPFASSWKGAANPDVTLTYFYDYACTYCRKSNPDIERLLAGDKGLRVVYRELPILGDDSVAAARVSLAASQGGKFGTFHDRLYALGRPSPQTIAQAANEVGVTPEAARAPAIEAEIQKNMQLANNLGATGTPVFVIGDSIINSAVGYDALKAAIDKARAPA